MAVLSVAWYTVAAVPQIAASGEPVLPADTKPVQLQPGQKVFPYYNPVYPGDAPDPALLRVGDHFFAATTGESIWRSPDLVDWQRVGTLFPAQKPAWANPGSPEIWAPDLNYIDGKYVAYFAARAGGYTDIYRGIGVAWAVNPEGPYHPSEEPLVVGPGFRHIDPMAFLDDNGKRYLYWGSASQPILVQELAPDGLSLVGEPKIALEPDPAIRYSRLIEAPWVIKRGDYYYIFWSGDGYHPGLYAVSVARSTSPFGPFERYSGNPILMESEKLTSPGHCAIIQDDAGQDWIVYHAYDKADTALGRFLLIDKLVWKDGWPTVAGRVPSFSPVADGPVWKNTAIPLVEVAHGKQVFASSERPGRSAQGVTDGSTYTGWVPAEDDTEPWVAVDLGAPQRVVKVELRLRKADQGDHGYLIETSRDGAHWQVFADRTRGSPTYPYVERNEATARYVRVRRMSSPTGADPALYEMRVFAYLNVWISNPDTLMPVTGPFPLTVHINPEMAVKSVAVSLDGNVVYEGSRAPAGPVATLVLLDGLHQAVLRVIDQNDAVWQHELEFTVKNARILSPTGEVRLHGTVPIEVATGYSKETIKSAAVSLIPVRYGELCNESAVVLYKGKEVPAGLIWDTRTVEDGAYDLQFTVEAVGGNVSYSTVRVVVKNWEVMTDEFEPPYEGWFGTMDLKKTIAESEGWDYDTTNPESFFGDANRRVWRGNETGHLIWQVHGLRAFSVVLYAAGITDVTRLEISVSPDQRQWQPVPFTVVEAATSGGWRKLQLKGEVVGGTPCYFRISLPPEMGPQAAQLGAVEFISSGEKEDE